MSNDPSWRDSVIQRCEVLAATDPQVRAAAIDRDALRGLEAASATCIEALELACELYADRPCLGRRATELAADGQSLAPIRSFATLSFGEVWLRIQALATGLEHLGVASPGTHVGICGFGGVDWVIADFACLYRAWVSVPLATAASVGDLQSIIRDAELTSVVCSSEQLALIEAVIATRTTITNVVVMDVDPRDRAELARVAVRAEALRAMGVGVYLFEDVIALGQRVPVLPIVRPGHDGIAANALMLLLFTSGSTGRPKGAMYTERVYHHLWRRPLRSELPIIPAISFSYLPLSHGAARILLIYALIRGGTMYFTYKSDLSTWLEDLGLVRPTSVHLVPRASEMLHQHFQNENIKANGVISDPVERAAASERTMARLRTTLLGERLTVAYTSAAPTSPEIAAFVAECFAIPVIDIYGSTENGGIVTIVDRISPSDVAEYKLADVPELGYTNADKPYPRGEFCIKTYCLVPGYINNLEATAGLFDDDGFMKTGDIMERRGDDVFAWIDRRAHVLKLAQGEFVNTARLEGVFVAASPVIEQIYVHGNSHRSYVLAVVVPNRDAVRARIGDADDVATRALIRTELDRVGVVAQLQGYEVPRDFLMTFVPFSAENGLMTESNKPARAKLRAYFGQALEALYARIEDRQLAALRALYANPTAGGVVAGVSRVVEAIYGIEAVDAQRPLAQLGGDSMTAVQLAVVLDEVFHVSVPASLLLSHATTPADIVARIEALGQAEERASFARVHGAHAAVVSAADLELDKLLSAEDQVAARAAAPPATGMVPRHALLTGATGFLGRFILLELLRQGTRVTCIARAGDDRAAFQRVRAGFGDGASAAAFETVAHGGALQVVAGDLARARFGLDPGVYDALARDVDSVVHAGALVNHALSYRHLFEPNVLGTVEVIRFALCNRVKAVTYISTAAIAHGVRQLQTVRETDTAETIWRAMPDEGGYAAGYVATKWASEVVLERAHERFLLPLQIVRCGTMLGHPDYLGQINATDYLTRLLHGIVRTGLAPKSFYAPGFVDELDGLPVDFAAAAIAALAGRVPATKRIVHAVGCDANGAVNLDTVVRWVRSAGYSVEIVDDHGEWFERFAGALRALDDRAQARSPLPTIQLWERPLGLSPQARIATTVFRETIADLAGLHTLPCASEALVHQWLRHMVHVGLIDAAA